MGRLRPVRYKVWPPAERATQSGWKADNVEDSSILVTDVMPY
jgi:hypothetical protein